MKINQITQKILTDSGKQVQTKPAAVKDPKLEKSAKDLEGLFVSFVLKSMEKTVPHQKEHQNNLSNMMFSSVMGKEIAEQGGLGLAKFFYNSLAQQSPEKLAELRAKMNTPTNYTINPARMEE